MRRFIIHLKINTLNNTPLFYAQVNKAGQVLNELINFISSGSDDTP